MKQIPILFSEPMISANMSGQKSMTRRTRSLNKVNESRKYEFQHIFYDLAIFKHKSTGKQLAVKCPYGQVDDILWVRENWRVSAWRIEDSEIKIEYAYGQQKWIDIHWVMKEPLSLEWLYGYISTLEEKGIIEPIELGDDEGVYQFKKEIPWRPSIHMPKQACRSYLKVKSIKVERLHDISEEDAINEGISRWYDNRHYHKGGTGAWRYKNYHTNEMDLLDPIRSFQTLWESINGKESWKSNPWVWVVEYEETQNPNENNND